MAKAKMTFDLVNRTSGKAVNLSGKFLGESLGKAEKVWVIRYEGIGVVLVPFDDQDGPEKLALQLFQNLGLVPPPAPAAAPDELGTGQPTEGDDGA